MEINRLRSIIRESISNNLKEIEDVAENAAMEAKLNAYTEAIDKVNKKIETAESLEEMQELVDPAKLNELKKHLKNLEKSKAKLEKVKAKKNKGKEVVTDEPVEEGDAMDSMENAIVPEMDYTMEEEEAINESFLKMQKLAGVITEAQYNSKKSLIENEVTKEISPEEAADTTEKAAEDLADNPEQVKQALAKAKQAGIDLNLVKQAADQLKQGKSYEDVIKSITNKVQENLNEESATNFRRKEKVKSTLLGTGVGAFISMFPAFGIFTAGAAGLAVEAPTSEYLIAMGIVALAGAALGYHFRDRDSGGKVNSYDIAQKAAWEFKNQMTKQGRPNTLPDVNLFYIVDNGETPKELNGKEIWRFKIGDRDAVGDKEALWKSKEAYYDPYNQP